MFKQFKEFDRTLFKTSKSRSIKFAQSKSSGFTLIELLVVISIIALLSTIISITLQDARKKAQNTAKNDIVLQYINALELYSTNNNGAYPDSAISGGNYTYSCPGFAESEGCFKINGANTYTGLNTLNSALSPYYKNLPKADDFTITVGTTEWKGVMYIKFNSQYKLKWYLQGNTDCIRGAVETYSGNKTLCTYPE